MNNWTAVSSQIEQIYYTSFKRQVIFRVENFNNPYLGLINKICKIATRAPPQERGECTYDDVVSPWIFSTFQGKVLGLAWLRLA